MYECIDHDDANDDVFQNSAWRRQRSLMSGLFVFSISMDTEVMQEAFLTAGLVPVPRKVCLSRRYSTDVISLQPNLARGD